jgi:ribonuclease VapC
VIYVDASAIVAVIVGEDRAEEIKTALKQADRLFTSPISVFEASMSTARIWNINPAAAQARIQRFLAGARIDVKLISDDVASVAVLAAERFGKGRHKAKLNMGDCFSYAMASVHDSTILFVGNDFSLTDLPSALPVSH